MILHLVGSINKHRLLELAHFLQDNSNAVIVRITSEGGDPDIGLAMAGLIKSWPGHVTTEVYGQCWSAATLIFAAGAVRRMQSFSWIMLHEGSEAVEGTASAVKACAKQMERNEAHWNAIMQQLTGTDIKVWEKLNERDTYLTADECLKLNLATEIF